MSKTTRTKMPVRSPRDEMMPVIAVAFTRDEDHSTLRIENGIHTEVEMYVTPEFCLALVGLLTAHFNLLPKQIAAVLEHMGELKPHQNF